jgi:hypothetical protein
VKINKECGSSKVKQQAEVGTMKMTSQMWGNVGFDKVSVTGTAKGDQPKQSAERFPSVSRSSFRQPVETMTDLQSYALMEERYGIREEGIF